jgi:hypothetical protein
MSRDDFRTIGHELVDRIAEHLATLPGGRLRATSRLRRFVGRSAVTNLFPMGALTRAWH